ncbi:MAG: hypothetical protein Q7R64_03090 [bacterium]|nr:hypothetical protein [bacterium]
MQETTPMLIRRLLFLTGALIVVAVVLWLFSRKDADKLLPENLSELQNEEALTTNVVPLDTDGDELPDFEEALWGTNPLLPDTDGDGTRDGDEVALRRNPNKAGQSDALETPLTTVEQPSLPEKSVIVRPITVIPSPITALPSATKSPTENPLHLYGNAVGTVIKEAGADADAELAFWNRVAGNTKMTSELIQGLAKLAQKYDKLKASIASVVPPEKALNAHKKLTETYQNYAQSLHTIAQTEVGSYLQGSVMMAYSESTLALARAVVDVSDLFYREQVVFGRSEPGAVFVFPR